MVGRQNRDKPSKSKYGRKKEESTVGSEGSRGFPIEGISAIREYLKFRPDAIKELWIAPEGQSLLAEIDGMLKGRMIPVHRHSREEMAKAWGCTALYGPIVALGRFKILAEAEGLSKLKREESSREVALLLDRIQDPRNLGAIIRTAAFFGVRHVFMPERRQVSLTPAVVSTAQGGLALLDLTIVTNLSRLVRHLKEQGYWLVGADMAGKVVDVKVRELPKIVLVLGNEADGIAFQLRNQCDVLVGLPSKSGLESLNVSVAAGILLSQLLSS
jgi:23S rRNA (guanosine2251-2'-O)-methyltransferase